MGKKVIYPNWTENKLEKAKVKRAKGFTLIMDNGEVVQPKEVITSKRKFTAAKKILAARRIIRSKKEIWETIEKIKKEMDIIEQAERELN